MFTQCRNNKQDGASAERSLPLNGIILSVAVFYLCGLGSCSSQDLVKTMKPSEKLTSACGRVLDLDCEAVAVGGVSLGPGSNLSPALWENAQSWLCSQMPSKSRAHTQPRAPPRRRHNKDTFVLLFLSLQLHNGHYTPKLCPACDNPSPWLERGVCGLFSPVEPRDY